MFRYAIHIFLCLPICLLGQEAEEVEEMDTVYYEIRLDRNLSLMLGYGYNFSQSNLLEIGIGINTWGGIGYHPHSSGMAISTEWRMTPWQDQLIGHKLKAWVGGGVGAMALGVNLIYYYGKNGNSLVFIPEAGMAIGPVNLVYGYLIPFQSDHLLGLSRHQLNVLVPLKLKRLKEIRRSFE